MQRQHRIAPIEGHRSLTQSSKYAKQLIDFTFTSEQGSIVGDLSEDRADTPKVNTGRVRLSAKQDLRRAIPQCHHLNMARMLSILAKVSRSSVSTRRKPYLMCVHSHGHLKMSSQSEICQFKRTDPIDENLVKNEQTKG